MTSLVLSLRLTIFGVVAFMYCKSLFCPIFILPFYHHRSSIKICVLLSCSVYFEIVQWLISVVLAAIPDSPHSSSCCLKFLRESNPLVKGLFFSQSHESKHRAIALLFLAALHCKHRYVQCLIVSLFHDSTPVHALHIGHLRRILTCII